MTCTELSEIGAEKFSPETVKVRRNRPGHKHYHTKFGVHYDIMLQLPEGRHSIGYASVEVVDVASVLGYLHWNYAALHNALIKAGADDTTEIIKIDAFDLFGDVRTNHRDVYFDVVQNVGQHVVGSLLADLRSRRYSWAYLMLSGWEGQQFSEFKENYGFRAATPQSPSNFLYYGNLLWESY